MCRLPNLFKAFRPCQLKVAIATVFSLETLIYHTVFKSYGESNLVILYINFNRFLADQGELRASIVL